MSVDVELEYDVFCRVMALPDGLTHRLIFLDVQTRYAVPVEVVIDPSRRACAIAATTPQPVEIDDAIAAEFFSAFANKFPGPSVEFDSGTRLLTAYNIVLMEELDGFPAFWNAIWDVTDRLRATVYRIDLIKQGLAAETVAQIDEKEFSRWAPVLARYQPFLPSSEFVTRQIQAE